MVVHTLDAFIRSWWKISMTCHANHYRNNTWEKTQCELILRFVHIFFLLLLAQIENSIGIRTQNTTNLVERTQPKWESRNNAHILFILQKLYVYVYLLLDYANTYTHTHTYIHIEINKISFHFIPQKYEAIGTQNGEWDKLSWLENIESLALNDAPH